MMVLVLTAFCGSPGACNRKQRKNWKHEGRGRLVMGRFVVGFRILVGRIVNEVSSITSWKVDRRVWTQKLTFFNVNQKISSLELFLLS
jgi:hypothetical protein